MKPNTNDAAEAVTLRKRAEAIVEANEAREQGTLSPEAMQDALHELHVHQIELEMQNDELQRARDELEESQALYFDLYHLAPVGYITLNEKNRILQANLTVAHLLEYDRSALLKQPFTRFILPEDEDLFYLHRKHLFGLTQPDAGTTPGAQQGGVARICELRLLRRESGPLWVQLESTHVLTMSGTHECRIMVSDITERKHAEEETSRLEALLRQRQRLDSVGTLAGGVAHEINNPLMGILNYAQMLHDEIEAGSPLQSYVAEIMEAGTRVASIVRHLSGLGRFDDEECTPVPLHDVVERALSLIRETLQGDEIALTIDVPPGLPSVLCNSHQVQQALMNVLINAHEALVAACPGPHANKIITISAHMIENGAAETIEGAAPVGRRVRLTVEDHGPGIPRDIQDRVFDPFFTTKGQAIYTGLGLSIAHSIVCGQGGRMSVESEEGRFTRLHMDLPVSS